MEDFALENEQRYTQSIASIVNLNNEDNYFIKVGTTI